MSGGTLLALAADEIVIGAYSVLGPIDPQIAGCRRPASSRRGTKPVEHVFDLTLVLADVGRRRSPRSSAAPSSCSRPRMERGRRDLAAKLAGGHWTHDYALTATEAQSSACRSRWACRSRSGADEALSAAGAAVRRRVPAYRHADQAAGVDSPRLAWFGRACPDHPSTNLLRCSRTAGILGTSPRMTACAPHSGSFSHAWNDCRCYSCPPSPHLSSNARYAGSS